MIAETHKLLYLTNNTAVIFWALCGPLTLIIFLIIHRSIKQMKYIFGKSTGSQKYDFPYKRHVKLGNRRPLVGAFGLQAGECPSSSRL